MATGISNEADRITTTTSMKGDDSSAKRKCLFFYLNENNKMISSDRNSKILLELDGFLCEESREENLLFTKKHIQ